MVNICVNVDKPMYDAIKQLSKKEVYGTTLSKVAGTLIVLGLEEQLRNASLLKLLLAEDEVKEVRTKLK